ncbi:hypothetical protein DL770_009254 [Monosporascus sp. CRB-9-2]|nr:hypothetical protein DL770_009254 [Monosporascus sp. CRB-9-2]
MLFRSEPGSPEWKMRVSELKHMVKSVSESNLKDDLDYFSKLSAELDDEEKWAKSADYDIESGKITEFTEPPPFHLHVQKLLGSKVDIFQPPPVRVQARHLLATDAANMSAVFFLCMLGAVTVSVSATMNSEVSATPNVDSDFYATLSGTSTAFAGTYTIIVPLLQGKPSPIDRKTYPRRHWIFNFCIAMALITSLASAITQLFAEGGSAVMNYSSTLFQIVATMIWIMTSTKKIQTLNKEVEDLEGAVEVLEGEVEVLEGEVEVFKAPIVQALYGTILAQALLVASLKSGPIFEVGAAPQAQPWLEPSALEVPARVKCID